ncbi:MAG: hypothetical protein ACRDG4_12410 [Chloroflexota bacterium]
MPGIGASRDYGNPRLKGMRAWPIPTFQKHVIFYQTTDRELRIIRVLPETFRGCRYHHPPVH